MTTTARPLPPHGSLSRHKHYGCGCDACHDAYRAYEQRRRRLRGYGTWQPLVDVQPVRQHLTALVAAGYTLHSIRDAARTDAATLQRALYGPTKTMRAETARALLAVRPQDMKVSPHRTVDAAGTRRRLQALVAIGWPLSCVATHLGMHPRPLTDLTRADRVTRVTAQRIEAGYRQLSRMNPAEHGVPQAAANRAALAAAPTSRAA